MASYSGDSQEQRGHQQRRHDEPVTTAAASPSDQHDASMPTTAMVGTSIADSATVTGGFNPTGTITFKLYSNGQHDRHAGDHRH